MLVFLLAWLKFYIAVPAVVALGFAFFSVLKCEDKKIEISISSLIIIGIIVSLWLYLSGIGGFFIQKQDYLYRNPMFRDLINYRWPVRYDTNDIALVYYMGHMLIPALIGKLAGLFVDAGGAWLAARIAMFIYSFVFIYTAILLLLIKLNKASLKAVCILLSVFILFSGMDYLGQYFTFKSDIHIEYWALFFQYSSMSTQLCWVFNQAIPAWLACSLAVNEENERAYAIIGLALIISSPFPLVGLASYMLVRAVVRVVREYRINRNLECFKDIFSLSNILSIAVIVPIFAVFYSLNSVTGSADNTVSELPMASELSSDMYIFFYVIFVLLEFLLISLVVLKKANIRDTLFVIVSLLIIPFIHIGLGIDFCMRASIPSLFILMILVVDYLVHIDFVKAEQKDKLRAVILVVFLIVGAITPFVEYRTSVRYYYRSQGELVSVYDVYSSLEELPMEEKLNFIGSNVSDSFFFKHLAR